MVTAASICPSVKTLRLPSTEKQILGTDRNVENLRHKICDATRLTRTSSIAAKAHGLCSREPPAKCGEG
jgi:hypothetical protein